MKNGKISIIIIRKIKLYNNNNYSNSNKMCQIKSSLEILGHLLIKNVQIKLKII